MIPKWIKGNPQNCEFTGKGISENRGLEVSGKDLESLPATKASPGALGMRFKRSFCRFHKIIQILGEPFLLCSYRPFRWNL